ncbi:MAG: hypothetical protein P9M15_03810 [Candidatus Electryoneaceae bacterium]|nr:hypothetical protein [Candidatus Electryoneaceae bacterium]
MAHENGDYLSDEGTVEKIYGYLQAGETDSAVAYLKGLGEDKIVVQTWINVQCDINNIKSDARMSAEIGRAGVDFCLEKEYLLPAAMMLHNISAFLMPNFDEGVAPADIPTILEAAKRQVILRRQIKQDGPLMWALWDEGLGHLAAGSVAQAIRLLEEGAGIARDMEDSDGEAWCRIFIGKAKFKYLPELRREGEAEMRQAAQTLLEIGDDWEKDSARQILESVGL